MKFQYLIIFLILSFGFSAHSKLDPNGRLIIKNVDVMTWPEGISALDALDIYIEIMNADPEAALILKQVNQKLQAHGISHVRDIFNYCPGDSQSDGGASAFFAQNSKVAGTRVSVPGLPEMPWTDSALTAQKIGFSSKVIKAPFLEFLVVSDRPEICIHKGKQLFYAYDSVVHEMSHFLLKDPFLYHVEMLSSGPLPDYTQTTVSETGGEFDAFRIGSAAALRFLRKHEIQGYTSGSYSYFSADGQLTDKEGLKNYLIKIYSDYYKNKNTANELNKAKLNIVETKLQILKTVVEPFLKTMNRDDLMKSLSDEIATLENLKSKM